MHRIHACAATRTRPELGIVNQPEPRAIGHFLRGRQLIAGKFLFSGSFIETQDMSIWDIAPKNPVVAEELQGFGWLDDLAAVGDAKSRACAQDWVADWIVRYGRGRGSGWTPNLVGRRLIRWIQHGSFLLRNQETKSSEAFHRSLAQQATFLSRRWNTLQHGLPRFEALTGMIYAGLFLQGMEEHVESAVTALACDCTLEIDDTGGILTRNPEELLEVLTLLTWTVWALTEMGHQPPALIMSAITRIAPTLRALRHTDGSLARFHGGGRGLYGRLDYVLAASGNKTCVSEGPSMGYARLCAGRTSIVVDAAAPSTGPASIDAHASTLAFEVTSGRRPIIVSCGSGRSFGEEWRRAGRATPSHSTVCLEGYSSSRLGPPSRLNTARQELLVDVPELVQVHFSNLHDGRRLELSHDGYRGTHGLTHARTLDLSVDGRGMVGEDLLTTLIEADKVKFEAALGHTAQQGIQYAVRFHMHPDVDATVDLGGAAIAMVLKSGETWILRHDGHAQMSLKPSVYLENGRLKPRPSQQVVLSGRTMAYATRVRWSLAKAQDTPDGIRDLVIDDMMDLNEN